MQDVNGKKCRGGVPITDYEALQAQLTAKDKELEQKNMQIQTLNSQVQTLTQEIQNQPFKENGTIDLVFFSKTVQNDYYYEDMDRNYGSFNPNIKQTSYREEIIVDGHRYYVRKVEIVKKLKLLIVSMGTSGIMYGINTKPDTHLNGGYYHIKTLEANDYILLRSKNYSYQAAAIFKEI